MDGTLTLSSKLSPFPFGAIAIASYTHKAALNFDESAKGVTLDLNGAKITSVEEIVHALARAGNLSGDSVKVSPIDGIMQHLTLSMSDSVLLHGGENSADYDCVARNLDNPRLPRRSSRIPNLLDRS